MSMTPPPGGGQGITPQGMFGPPIDAKGLRWTTLSDFTPGIYSKTRAYSSNAAPAPLGAAQVTNTYRCICLPSGGLAPGPKLVLSQAPGAPEGSFSNVSFGYKTVGLMAWGPVIPSSGTASVYPDELLYATEYITTGNVKKMVVYRIRNFLATPSTDTLLTVAYPGTTTVNSVWGQTWGTTRMTTDINAVTNPGYPTAVFSYWSQMATGATDSAIVAYPDPTTLITRGALSTKNLLTGTTTPSTPGATVLHQGRTVLLQTIDYAGPNLSRRINEQVVYTNPKNYSAGFTTSATVLNQENPTGFGAWGSINGSILLLVKSTGGGILVSGELTSPQIINVPGVASCGENVSNSAPTAHGLFYIGGDDGVWVWRGGDSSQKVSEQIEDGSFLLSTYHANVAYSLAEWSDWILTTNNWLYDVETGGWWRIEDPASKAIWTWSKGSRGNHMYGAEISYTNAAPNIIHTWDREQNATSYSWQSHPIHVSVNRYVSIDEIAVLARGSGTVTITLTPDTGSAVARTFTFASNTNPQLQRRRVGVNNQYVTVRIEADSGSTTAAPVVESVRIGWKESQLTREG